MLQLRLLGVPEIQAGGAPVTERLPGKVQAILFYLAITGQPQTRTVLAPLLWGDMPDEAARSSLRKALSSLRQELGDYLEIDRRLVGFKPELDLRVDAVAFERDIAAASSPVDPERLQAAVDLYQGDFLTGFYARNAPDFEAWMYAEQGRLRELMVQALTALAGHYAGQGDPGRGIATVRRLLGLEPWREEAHRQLMLLLARDGQRAAALAQYETCQQVLAEELGVEPGPETKALYEQVQAGELTAEAPEPAIRDETRAPPPRRPAFQPNLPAQATPFVGRKQEITDIIGLLQEPDCRLLTLAGPGGTGKTRLAVQVAQRLAGRSPGDDGFGDGVLFVPLAGAHATSELLSAIAGTAGFRFYNNAPPKQQLLDFLCDKELLLVLDNFEHLLPEGALLSQMLATAPGVKILVTSQEALNIHEEWFHPIEGLPYPPADETGAAALDYDAVRVFEQSARRARPGFSLANEQEAVVRICRLVEGMPLAIELAAAWLKVLPAEKIAGEIERGLDVLSARHHNLPERHRNIRAVFEYSWQLLGDNERNILKRLPAFSGSFDQEAAEQVAGASLPVLAVLVEKSLLRVTANGRYGMHLLLCRYVTEKLAEDPAAQLATRERHGNYYLEFLKSREAMLSGQDQSAAVAEIGAEIENVRLAWLWAVEQNDLAAIQQTLSSYFNFYVIHGRFQEGEEGLGYFLDNLHEMPELPAHPEFESVKARALIRRGAFCYLLGEYDRATRYTAAGLAIRVEEEYRSDVAFGQLVMGVIAGWQGKQALAEEWLSKSLAISKEIDDKENMADALHELAQIRSSFGDYPQAKRLAEESLAVSRAYGRPDWIAHALIILGWAVSCLGEYAEAEAYYREALSIFETLGNRYGAAGALDGLGWVAWCREKFDEADRYYERSLALMRELGHRRLLANTLCDLAILANEQEEFAKAEAISREGMRLAEELDSPVYRVAYLCCLGSAECGRGNYADCRLYLSEAMQMAYDIELWPSLTFILFHFARLLFSESEGGTAADAAASRAEALELLSFVTHHPTAWQPVRQRAARLQARLEAELPADVAAAARTQGESKTLERVVAEILQDGGP